MDFYKDEDEEELFSMTRGVKTADDFDERYKDAIPIGSVRFIEQYLRIFKGIERDNAIEVPLVLRTDEFLKRKYSIVSRDDIPRQGYYFIKDATQQKVFSYKGEVEHYLQEEMFREKSHELDSSIRLVMCTLCQGHSVIRFY